MLIHVAIVSDQTLANLIPALTERPAKVYLACSESMARKGIDRRLKTLLEPHGIGVEVVPRAPDVGLMQITEYARRLATRIRAEHSQAEIVLNATGGTKPMVLGFVDVFSEVAVRVLYTDTQHRRIEYLPKRGKRVASMRPMKDVLDVPRYLQAQGFIYEGAVSDSPEWRKRADGRKNVTEYLAQNVNRLGGFIGAVNTLAHQALDKNGENLVNPEQSFKEAPGGEWETAIKRFEKSALLRRRSDVNVEFLNAESTRFLNGGWLEEYAWHTVVERKVFDARMGVRGSWEAGKEARNEFDVLATHSNQLLFIECKTLRYGAESEKDSNALYKADSLGQDARGLFGSTWLLSARKPSKEMGARAQAQGIRILGPADLPRLSDIVDKWMTG